MAYAYMGGNCYGRGDYYRGDYYRGDPGLFGSIGKALVGGVKGFIGGGPIGAITGAAAAVLKQKNGGKVTGTALAPLPPEEKFVGFRGPLGVQLGYEQKTGGQVTALVQTPDGRVCAVPARLNKSTYVTRGGGTSRWPRELIVHPKGTECVRSRRMNVANPQALRRAIRRGRGFIKLSRKAAGAFGFTVVSRSSRRKGVARRK